MSGDFPQGGPTTFIMTGFYYEGALPDAKAIADYTESIVREAVAVRFGLAVPHRLLHDHAKAYQAMERTADRCTLHF